MRYLGKLDLYPGTEIEVVASEPYEGPIVIKAGEREFPLGRGAAQEIMVS